MAGLKAEALLARADALRDQALWEAAGEAYGAYLAEAPEDWRAMVQRGHMVKEAGDWGAALTLYRAAEAFAPEDSDLKTHIGGVLKRLGDVEAAFASYAEALALDPANPDAGRELMALAPATQMMVSRPRKLGVSLRIVFDASDLIAWFVGQRAPTGIQRVQLNIIARALAAPPEGVAIAVVAFYDGAGFWREVSPALFIRLWRLSRTGADIHERIWVEAVEETRRQLREGSDFPFAAGACLVNLGTSWWIKDYFLRVRHAQRRFGIRYIPFVHDCIPMIVPEHCAANLVQEFAQWFSGLAVHADGLLANSECTARDAQRFLGEVLPGLRLPQAVIRLDAMPEAMQATDAQALPIDDEAPFVLVVGTIESRKNHLLLFQAWLSLIRRHGAARVPQLVCVGKPGWLAEPAMGLLAASPALAEKVTVLHGIADPVLATLYRRALFSIYNSFYEGWGLPVTESLGHGRIAVVPRHSSLVEAGEIGGVFFEPQSEPDLLAKIEPLIFDPAARAAGEAVIAARLKLRDWGEIAQQVIAAVREMAAAEVPGIEARLAVAPAEEVRLGLLGRVRPGLDMARGEALREGLNWHVMEGWGCWTRPGCARLRLPLAAPLPHPTRLYLGLAAPASARGPVAVGVGRGRGVWASVVLDPAERRTAFLDLDGAGEAVLLELEALESSSLPQRKRADVRRLVGVGVTAMMLCRRDDRAARIDFLERHHFLRL